MKLLITSGGTEEPIDGVRYITNFSTGKTGVVLAQKLSELGNNVTLLHGHRAAVPSGEIETDSFTDFESLNKKLKSHLGSGEFDGIIHLAAVSDFSVEYITDESGKRFKPLSSGKLSSDNSLDIHLKRNFKIIDKLKEYGSGKNLLVIGFKLTDTDSRAEMKGAVHKMFLTGKVDYVVQNNLRDINENNHPAQIYSSGGDVLYETNTKNEMP